MTAKPDVRFIVTTRSDSHPLSACITYTAELEVCVMGRKDDDCGKVLNPGHFYSDDLNYPTNALEYLCITSQASDARGDDSTPTEWYGWHVRYMHIYDADLSTAEAMVKVLRKVKAAMNKHEREFGRPESFVQFATIAARAAGAITPKPFGARVGPERDFLGTGWRWMDADGLRYMLADTLAGKTPVTSQRR